MSRCEFLFLFAIYPPRICRMISFISFQKFSAMILIPLFLFLSFGTSIGNILDLLYHPCLITSTLFFNFIHIYWWSFFLSIFKKTLEKTLTGWLIHGSFPEEIQANHLSEPWYSQLIEQQYLYSSHRWYVDYLRKKVK